MIDSEFNSILDVIIEFGINIYLVLVKSKLVGSTYIYEDFTETVFPSHIPVNVS